MHHGTGHGTRFAARAAAAAALALFFAAAPDCEAAARTNRWVRREGADARASVAGNWSLGHPPTAGETALFSARNPVSAIWDEAAPSEIGGLVLDDGWLAVLTLETSPSGPLRALKVAGDVSIRGGALTHPQCGSEPRWALCVEAGGDFEVGPDAIVSASGKGFAPGAGPSPGRRPGWGASHGGQGAPRAMDGNGLPALCPGSFLDPSLPGSGGTVAAGAGPGPGHGGGVVRIRAGGNVSVFGKIRADADSRDKGGVLLGGAAGGSVCIEAGGSFEFGPDAAITADGGDAFHDGGGGGGGGRIAIRAAGGPLDLGKFSGWSAQDRRRIRAWGGVGETRARSNSDADSHIRAAPGTVYCELAGPDSVPGSGTLCVYGQHRPALAATRLPGDGDGAAGAEDLRDGSLCLLDTAFVTLGGPMTVQKFGFSIHVRGALDLNGNVLTSSGAWNGYADHVLETPGVHRSNDDRVFDLVSFGSGGSVVLRPYFKPAL